MNASDDLGYLLQHTAFVLARQSDQVLLEQLGIGFSQFKILLILEQSTGTKQKQIAEKLGQTEASISRQIKLSQDNGLLVSQVSPNNRREHIIRLTPKGIKVTQKAMEILNNYHSPVFNKLSERQQQQLRGLLTIMHESICHDSTHQHQ
jgi:DNA-binding MarR family transcriptional regulator